jgi:hypothetical protein
MKDIGNQVRLPVAVAAEVVAQGIRIRLGRSLVTLTSVALGIAFLSAILTGQVVKDGVKVERLAREETVRRLAALESETGPLAGRSVAVAPGARSQADQRLIAALAGNDVRVVDGAAADAAAILVPQGAAIPAGAVGIIAGDGLSAAAPTGARLVEFRREPTADEIAAAQAEEVEAKARTGWITGIALLVTAIGIANAMLMSVTERFREIGTMKCLGALSGFIRQVFVLEASLLGLVGGVIGALLGAAASWIGNGFVYGFAMVAGGTAWGLLALLLLGAIVASVVLAVAAALYPAMVAANMRPANALRSSV